VHGGGNGELRREFSTRLAIGCPWVRSLCVCACSVLRSVRVTYLVRRGLSSVKYQTLWEFVYFLGDHRRGFALRKRSRRLSFFLQISCFWQEVLIGRENNKIENTKRTKKPGQSCWIISYLPRWVALAQGQAGVASQNISICLHLSVVTLA